MQQIAYPVCLSFLDMFNDVMQAFLWFHISSDEASTTPPHVQRRCRSLRTARWYASYIITLTSVHYWRLFCHRIPLRLIPVRIFIRNHGLLLLPAQSEVAKSAFTEIFTISNKVFTIISEVTNVISVSNGLLRQKYRIPGYCSG